jgi:uncharacterized protein (TIGR02300 family)
LEEVRVPKVELGQKRVCGHCGAKFYDLNRDPIHCPKCGTAFDVAAASKPRRTRAVAEEKPSKAKKVPKLAEVADAELPDTDADEAVVVDDDEEEEGVIEDASELGEDEDDMAEVIENVDEDPER